MTKQKSLFPSKKRIEKKSPLELFLRRNKFFGNKSNNNNFLLGEKATIGDLDQMRVLEIYEQYKWIPVELHNLELFYCIRCNSKIDFNYANVLHEDEDDPSYEDLIDSLYQQEMNCYACSTNYDIVAESELIKHPLWPLILLQIRRKRELPLCIKNINESAYNNTEIYENFDKE